MSAHEEVSFACLKTAAKLQQNFEFVITFGAKM